jgi:DNA polymerase
MKREKIWIGNFVRYRPIQNNYRKNRKPTKSEVKACLPILQREIEIIDPKIIVTLGTTAINALMEDTLRLKEISGKIFEYNNRILFPTYHPAAAYRFPSIKNKFQKDYKKLEKFIRTEIGKI